MFHVIYKRIVLHQNRTVDLTAPPLLIHLYSSLLHQNPSFLTKSQDPDPSFTVSYLINSYGLSPQLALSVSQKICLKSSQKPDAVLKLLRNHGFCDTHIVKIISKCPSLLSANVDKNLQPKLDFFKRLGFVGPTLARILSSDPYLLLRSLDDHILPAVDFLKSFVHTDENIAIAFRRFTGLLRCKLDVAIAPNVSILRDSGVPESMISKMIISRPRTLNVNVDQFRMAVKLVKDMGFSPSKLHFTLAVSVMMGMRRSKWERKVGVYRSLGWSESQFLSAFRLQPMCMVTSEEKITRIADFFLSHMDIKPLFLSNYPQILILSLEGRIIPRCSVLQIVMSKGLIKKDLSIYSALRISEEDFLKRFVIRYEESVPGIQTLYQAKMGIARPELGSEDGI